MRAALTLTLVVAAAASFAKPKLEPFKTDDGVIAFVVEATNGSPTPLHVVSYMGQCTIKIDGSIAPRNAGGSGGGRTIQPGQTWKELIRLVTVRDPDGRHHPNPDPRGIAAIHELEVKLTPGKHAISMACAGGDSESNEVEFVWPAKH